LAPQLDVLLLGEDLARGLGTRVQLVRLSAGGAAVMLAATAVSVAGPIGFVGLMAPHLGRLSGVPGHGLLLPAAAVRGGGPLLLGADVLARAVPSTSTPLPVGAATAFLGAPLIMWLARRSAGGGQPVTSSRTVVARFPPYAVLVCVSVALLGIVCAAGLSLGA